uniref:Fibronectin type III and ankyrin repeat domains 1 n=1 Tax=Crocodylus porosus TaxID=8502 RepID=A0A7M4ERL8_CROPO
IQLSWDLENKTERKGPQEEWLKYSIEEEDPKVHTYGTIYRGYARQFVVDGLEPRTAYRFRLKVTTPEGQNAYSSAVSVSTTREPMSGEQLHRAVSMNDVDAVLNILQRGHVKVDVPDKLGFTALMVASQKGYDRYYCLSSNCLSLLCYSLMLACFAGHLNIIKFLKAQGASWEARDLGGCTALHWAVDGGHCEVVEWMINDGCQVDTKDTCLEWTPLMRVSAVTGKKDVASLLIEAGADVNVKDKDGKTPLMVAVLNNHEELIQLLLENGANPNVKNEYGKGLLEMARSFHRQGLAALLEEKMKKKKEESDSQLSEVTQ